MLKIIPVLCRAGKMDNYAYILQDTKTKISAVLDPSESKPVIDRCELEGICPNYVFNTHHHFDHVEGNLDIKEKYGAKIVVGEHDKNRIIGADIALKNGDVFDLGESKAQIIRVDGHTIGHILWYFAEDKVLFTGDTLFNLSIGGLFEGSVEQMWNSLQKIKQLPDDVLFYPGHEYTIYGMQNIFGEEAKKYIAKALSRLEQNLPVAPVCLGEEKSCNPYLKADNLVKFHQLLSS